MRLHLRSWGEGERSEWTSWRVSKGYVGGRGSRNHAYTHYWFLSMCSTFLPSTESSADNTHSVTPVLEGGEGEGGGEVG